jgi:pyruvate decarboxylase
MKLDVILFLINNHGYTIERCIHGMRASYNDVALWRYLKAPDFFGADKEGLFKAQTYKVATWGELESVIARSEFQDGRGLRMVEVMMQQDDAPTTLLELVEQADEENNVVSPPSGALST